MKTIVIGVADDRMGRKNSLYTETQYKIEYILNNNPQLGIDEIRMWKWEDVAATDFYTENKIQLDNIDASRNGRVYKPFIILEALKSVGEGDYVVYTDCSPELWNFDREYKFPFKDYNLSVLHNLCKHNGDILSIFVKWDAKEIKQGQLGIHTHKNFTLNRCMNKMGMRQYEDCFMGASGMWAIRKTEKTLAFVTEWLKWNCDEDCCSLGKVDVPDDYSFWVEEKDIKMGHRHDQSISGLLLNKMGHKLVDILYNDISPYNFLQYTRTEANYTFINSVPKYEAIEAGSSVLNEKGIELTVWRIEEDEDGTPLYIVGKSEASTYATKREYLTKNIKI